MDDVTAALMRLRTAIATDAHAYASAGENRPMMLACREWPGERGLVGHSDGDVAAHAACDALLQAAELGDLGATFGVGDPQWRGVSGAAMLHHTSDLLNAARVEIINVSIQIIGNTPRISPHRIDAQQAMSTALGAPVRLTATTTDGMGFTGRGEGLGAVANALVLLPHRA